MKKAVVLLIMSFFLLGVSEAKVEDIFERARERYLKFREVATDITMVQTFTARGKTVVERRIYKKGEMSRIEKVEHGDVLTINIYDGENFWTVVPDQGRRQKLSQRGRRGFFLDDWFNYFDEMWLKFDRVERFEGRNCYVLTRDDLFLWIDTESLALVKFEGEGSNEKDEKDEKDEKEKLTITFSDFRAIEGWEIPLTGRISTKGGETRALIELSLDVETVLPMELFCAESIEIGDPPPDPS